MRCRSRRGFTLIEVMIAGVVGLVTVLAALGVFNVVNDLQTKADRLSGIYSEIQLGTTILQRELENGGYQFNSPANAIHVINAVVSGTNLSNGPGAPVATVPVVDRASTDEGIIAGSDVVEVWQGGRSPLVGPGTGARSAGQLVQVIAGGTTVIVRLFNDAPMVEAEVSAPTGVLGGFQGPLLLFSNATTSCLGIVENRGGAWGDGTPRYQVRLVDQDLADLGAAPANCPAAGMSVYGAEQRRRYMVYRFAGERSPSLVMQRSLAVAGANNAVGTLGELEVLVEGIDDLQVAPRLFNAAGGICVPPADGRQFCQCNDSDVAPQCLMTAANAQWVRGAMLELTSVGVAPFLRRTGERLERSFDRPPQPVDGILRHTVRIAAEFPNLNPSVVTPL
jgi:prepilin-type N-terminal cleavage/methylation domain-containing protein